MPILNPPDTVFFVAVPVRRPLHHDHQNSLVIADAIHKGVSQGHSLKRPTLVVGARITTASLYSGPIMNTLGLKSHFMLKRDLGPFDGRVSAPARLLRMLPKMTSPGGVAILVGDAKCLQTVVKHLTNSFWKAEPSDHIMDHVGSLHLGLVVMNRVWPELPMVASLPLLAS